ncbi:MAG: plastocyanin/azurin family copper-binding protein [Acidobacteriota bacterium]|nr:plastocyanin/azurin family copper-binding protein [Acidobacteriota bacterium]
MISALAGTAVVSGLAPAAVGGFASVVMLTPVNAQAEDPAARRRFVGQFGYAFTPALLASRSGDEVEFSNDEEVIHNVHVVDRATGETVFNVTTLQGIPYAHTFDEAGVYDVSCNVHPQMSAIVVVDAARFMTVADQEGRFSLKNVPGGTYTVRVWNPDPTRRSERRVEVVEPEIRLELTS